MSNEGLKGYWVMKGYMTAEQWRTIWLVSNEELHDYWVMKDYRNTDQWKTTGLLSNERLQDYWVMKDYMTTGVMNYWTKELQDYRTNLGF